MSPEKPLASPGSSAVTSDAGKVLHGPRYASRCEVAGLSRIASGSVVAGAAHTMRLVPAPAASASNRIAFLEAYEAIPSGAVCVVEVGGDVGGAVLGDVIAHFLVRQAVAAVVVEGQVRDVGAIRELGLPVWSRGVTPRSMVSPEVLTLTGVEVRCGGVTVNPGDYIVGDDDGIVVVPSDLISAVLTQVHAFEENEGSVHEGIANGGRLSQVYSAKVAGD